MHKILKTGAVLAATGMLVAGLTGCGGTNGTSNTSKSSSTTSSSANKNANSSAGKSSSSSQKATQNIIKEVSEDDPYAVGKHQAVLTVEGYDPINITLDADAAPVTVSNFCKLANDGFYDGLTFYRFVDNFCMQGGSSNNSAASVNDGHDLIVGEFSKNKKENTLADNFKKGVVAMARSSDPNSASTTFFVTLGSDANVSASLNGQYAAFGTIDDAGMKVVDAIVADKLPKVNDPSSGSITKVEDQAKITSIKITS